MAPKKMKFQVYCDEAAPAPVVSAPQHQSLAKSSLASLSRRELQALAKREGIKANLKSAAIIRELTKHGVTGSGKAALQDIENIDPQKLGNRANRQAKPKPVMQNERSEKQVSSSDKAKQAAQLAFEREKARRMRKLMEAHPAAQERPEVKVEKVQPRKRSQTDSATQTPQPSVKDRTDEVRTNVAKFVVFDVVYAGVKRAQTELCRKEAAPIDTNNKIKEFLLCIEEGLARQEELKQQLRGIRESRKQFQLQHASRSWVACTPFKKCSKTPSSVKTLPAQLRRSEKENVTPGCKLPVCGSSLYYSERKRSTRTPLANISQRGAPTPHSNFRFKRI